ncbi:Suc_Fer-like domain-containing protein [Cephalotus follicularis]|uniref:Suc_Fer-like domain-containing protein n=1 Tax=Cephalotus follicularis TaxID=3775 RepID=A0A1Q3BL51_CEPFO|nr:Suc_Fer-like domain-containing protein [Cephalotus follicularis]
MRIAHPTRSLISLGHHFPSITHLFHSPQSLTLTNTKTKTRTVTVTPLFMANTESFSSISAEDDAKFGFTRAEMYKSNLANTVDPYDRHVFLCYKSPDAWASRVESSDTDLLPKLLSSALKARKDDIVIKTKLTICGGGEGTDGDVLIFPEMIKYKGLKDSDVDSFVEDVLVNSKPWGSGEQEVLIGSHVFVCAHGSRDKRCGVCGPALMEKLEEEIELRGLKDQVFVSPCSHIGGHKYAGNLIIYGPGSEGKVVGHWYGYVTPNDVPAVLDQHIAKGEIIERLWRGQMGVYTEGEKVDEKQLPNGKEVKKSKKKHEESKIQEKEIAGGCCQGANGVSCCSDGSMKVTGDKLIDTTEVHGKTGGGKVSCLVGSWEQSEVLTAAAVIGAVVTVAVAYSFYRRSG